MKPTIQFNETSRRDFCDRDFREGSAFPKTDYGFQSASVENGGGGRCFDSNHRSFRSISQDYFKNEARHSFAREAALFTVIVMIAAVPIISSVNAFFHLVRSFGTL